MRMFEIVTFNVSFGGYWVKKRSGDVGYIGRDVKTIECKPEELFISLLDEFGEGLYVQRLWYTLPFENHKDRKKLSYVRDDDFRMMCKAVREYEASLEAVKRYDIRVFEAMMEKNPKNCSLAFCSLMSSCLDVHNNISESFNNAIDPARYMPMVEMLETIRRATMVRIDLRKRIAAESASRFPSRITKLIDAEQRKLKFCKIIPRES
ncbi:hypothetical protein HID58_046202 [Brassica napus]|uniref:Uncharacterized protein n=1 Tax=Brassica napus TaxID=3708 RepID=A0ABQ8AVS7_BRANA|nr:hypothetical protein HID58_046202 [Brassica napus]